jgi:glycosyltransferase involved in cell wall biosynthesis
MKDDQFEVSIVVPMRTVARELLETIESIFLQDKVSFEVIFVDGGSCDRTLEIVKPFTDGVRAHLITLSFATDVQMIEEGIKKASGKYVQVLFPGSSYLMPDALFQVMHAIYQTHRPELFYTASYVKERAIKQKFLFLPLREELLRLGQMPTSLECCFFKKEIFEKARNFWQREPLGQNAFALELFIHIFTTPDWMVDSEMRVFVKERAMEQNWTCLFCEYKEIARVIRKYFGFSWALWWLFKSENLATLFTYIKRKIEISFQKK